MFEGLLIGIGVGIGFCGVVIPTLLLLPRNRQREQREELTELMRQRNDSARTASHYLRVCALGYVQRDAAERLLRCAHSADRNLLENDVDTDAESG